MQLGRDDLEILSNAIVNGLVTALQRSRSVSEAIHADHHRFIEERIAEHRARTKFFEELKTHCAKWGVVSLITVTGYALFLYIKMQMKS